MYSGNLRSVGTAPVRAYTHYKTSHVVYLSQNYHLYTLKELETQLGIPWQKLKRLAERNGIKKRRPNKQKVHIQDSCTALA